MHFAFWHCCSYLFFMCYRPLKITNNTRYFSAQYDKVYNTVPCGHCGECLQRKQNDLIVRSYFEHKKAKQLGGFGLFSTLTYAPDTVPMLFHRNTGECLLCFNKLDVQKFNHAFRKRLNRKYGHVVKYKYIITSEFGGKTFRPHYHVNMFFYEPISPSFVRATIRDLWFYGFVKFGDNQGIINSISAIRYVCKYITKDIDFHSDQLDNIVKPFKDSSDETYNYIKNTFFPFHLISNGFGECLTEYVPLSELLQGKVSLPYKHGFKVYHIPLYNDRKLFYSLDPETKSYRLTELGYSMKVARSEDSKRILTNYINEIRTTLPQWLDNETIHQINSYFAYDKKVSKESIIATFSEFFHRNSIDEFIHYLINRRDFTYKEDVSFFPTEELNQPLSPVGRTRKYLDNYFGVPRYYDFSFNASVQKELKQNLYNEFYPELEKFSQLYDLIRFQYGKYKNQCYYEQQKAKSRSKLYKQ